MALWQICLICVAAWGVDQCCANGVVVDVTEQSVQSFLDDDSTTVAVLAFVSDKLCPAAPQHAQYPCLVGRSSLSKKVEPQLISAAKSLEGKARVGRVDAEKSPALVKQYQIRGVPNMKIFR